MIARGTHHQLYEKWKCCNLQHPIRHHTSTSRQQSGSWSCFSSGHWVELPLPSFTRDQLPGSGLQVYPVSPTATVHLDVWSITLHHHPLKTHKFIRILLDANLCWMFFYIIICNLIFCIKQGGRPTLSWSLMAKQIINGSHSLTIQPMTFSFHKATCACLVFLGLKQVQGSVPGFCDLLILFLSFFFLQNKKESGIPNPHSPLLYL